MIAFDPSERTWMHGHAITVAQQTIEAYRFAIDQHQFDLGPELLPLLP
jgi:hypothetical protein